MSTMDDYTFQIIEVKQRHDEFLAESANDRLVRFGHENGRPSWRHRILDAVPTPRLRGVRRRPHLARLQVSTEFKTQTRPAEGGTIVHMVRVARSATGGVRAGHIVGRADAIRAGCTRSSTTSSPTAVAL